MSPSKGGRRPARKPPATETPRNVTIPSVPLPAGSRGHPVLGLGLWALGRWAREDEERTRRTAERAVARSVPWFDTAEVYGAGRSERILGDVLSKVPADAAPPFITTKVSWEHLKGPMVRASLLGSLQRLGRPRVDGYLVHAPSPHVPIGETMAALDALQVEGRIGVVGVSNFGPEELRAAAAALPSSKLAIDQVRFNLLEPEEGDAVLAAARELGIVVEAYTPLARGLLAGRYLDGEAPTAGVRNMARDLFDQDVFGTMRARAQGIRKVADREGVPMAALALHWLAARGAAPVVGASRPEQVDEMLAAWASRPSDAALERAEAIARGHGSD